METFLSDAGYYKPLTGDGPSGSHNANLDQAIRSFQKDKGLEVDGGLKPGGPTIGKIGSLLGGGEVQGQHAGNPGAQPQNFWGGPKGDWPEQGGITGTLPSPHDWDRLLQGHTINQEGIDANQGYAEMLLRDSDPSQTVRMLKRAIDNYGDQGRGDVADLLARFQKIDGAKAETLRRELHKATGEMLPYRLAPLGEGFREPTEEERIAAAPKAPFGSAQGADRWAAGNMADALLGKGDYTDAVTHFRGEIGRNRAQSMPYLAAVHEIMGEKNPALAARFATQMDKAGLTGRSRKRSRKDLEMPASCLLPFPQPSPLAPFHPPSLEKPISSFPRRNRFRRHRLPRSPQRASQLRYRQKPPRLFSGNLSRERVGR
ncbi:peptidoglycan-binding protein [Magnetospirillum molischianum]|uniref:peptidoglycan-binding protein n=1 Tax=Magnetospirillum molischianum TaxID=1083 RepID=UPI0002F2B82C|nr:peptidoglycan-binding protein [Magnetospirillum molischianum]